MTETYNPIYVKPPPNRGAGIAKGILLLTLRWIKKGVILFLKFLAAFF